MAKRPLLKKPGFKKQSSPNKTTNGGRVPGTRDKMRTKPGRSKTKSI